jgi:imidazolonepropionase-like amidohydrolase
MKVTGNRFSRRQFLGGATAAIGLGGGLSTVHSRAQPQQPAATGSGGDLAFINGRVHTMDPTNRVVSQILIRNGRFAAAGDNIVARGGNLRIVDLRGRTVIPGIIDAHNHIVLVGNRPGWHTALEHVFTIPDAIAALKARAAVVPSGQFITTVGPISAMQFDERRLPNLTELDAVGRPVYIQAAQGGEDEQRGQGMARDEGCDSRGRWRNHRPGARAVAPDPAQGAPDSRNEEAERVRRAAVLRAPWHHHAS